MTVPIVYKRTLCLAGGVVARQEIAAMPRNDALPSEEQHFILSTVSPSTAQKSLAAAVVCGILAVYVSITVIPIKGVYPVDAFVPAYVTVMFVCDVITAVLLYTQFAIVRSRATLVVASAYLFAALVMIPFILVFPGVFVPGKGVMGGMQSTSWVYFFAHAGFPLFIIGYALIRDAQSYRRERQGVVAFEIALSITLTVAIVFAGAVLFIVGEPILPRVNTDAMTFGAFWWYPMGMVILLNIAAIVVLWARQRVALDLWLMVVMFLYAIEIPLTYYPEPHRFSVAWLAVRGFGILSSSIVLMLLIHEIATLYARLLGAVLGQRREREARLLTGEAVAAAVAHEIRQPLTAMVTTADAALRFMSRAAPNLERVEQALRTIVADGHRAGAVVANIRANFKTDVGARNAFDLNQLIHETLAVARSDLVKHGIVVRTEANGQLPDVHGNRVQFQQVLLNLIMNAVDAMASKDAPRILTVKSAPYQEDRVMVSIVDTGPGITPEDAERIFNPRFTTKSDGMGMGLTICRAIIEADGGQLSYATNSSGGAEFQFTLQTR